MLRVRLDHCEQRAGVVWFDGALLSGAGAELIVGGSGGLRAGTVLLWEYVDGVRVGVWRDPDLGGDQRLLLLHWIELDEFIDEGFDDSQWHKFPCEDFFHLDGKLFTGGLVFFDGAFVRGIEQMVDGDIVTNRQAYWSVDGHLDHYEDWHVLPWGDRAMRVLEKVTVGRGWIKRPAPVHDISFVEFVSGHADSGTPIRFRKEDYEDPNRVFIRFQIAKDAEGRVCQLINIGDDNFFEIAGQFKRSLLLRGDHALAPSDFASMSLAPQLHFSMGVGLAREVIDALGGISAFSEVRNLRGIRKGWERDLMALLCALPNLESLDLSDEAAAEVARDLVAELQPDRDVVVTFHNGHALPE